MVLVAFAELTHAEWQHPPASPPPPQSVFVRAAEKVISFHQNILSPVDGPRSHFYPSSSQYMRLAMRKHGFVKGFFLGCDRLMRENSAEWVYRTVQIEDGRILKYDPVPD
jgi:putative component of membrane protein insertase Oxa1/YidC/SpoIIIJ protein YidD